jgi:hypothetical protein
MLNFRRACAILFGEAADGAGWRVVGINILHRLLGTGAEFHGISAFSTKFTHYISSFY